MVSFRAIAGWLAMFVAIGGLAYGILFAWIVTGAPDGVGRILLILGILGGLTVTGVFNGLHEELRDASSGLSRWALLLGTVAGLGQMLNASVSLGYSLGTAPLPPGDFGGTPDPLGILRFGLNGVALLIFGWLMARSGRFPRSLAYLAELGGALLVVMYLGRVTGLITPAVPASLIPPLLYGLVVHPIVYAWLGRQLLRPRVSEAI